MIFFLAPVAKTSPLSAVAASILTTAYHMLNDGARFVLASGCRRRVDFAVAVRFQYLHLSPMIAAASTSLVVSSNTDIIGRTAP
jgi:hypothetical protein